MNKLALFIQKQYYTLFPSFIKQPYKFILRHYYAQYMDWLLYGSTNFFTVQIGWRVLRFGRFSK